MKKIMACILSVLLFIPCAFASEVGKITYVDGRVDVLKAGSELAVPVREGEIISAGDSVRTKSNSKAEVTFKDSSVLRLAQNSRVEVKEYELDKNNKRKTATIKLDRGKARTIIAKMANAADFNILTPNAEGKVRGSDIFTFYQAGSSGILVAEGKLELKNVALPETSLIIPAGNSALVNMAEAPKGPRPYMELERKMHEEDTLVPPSARKFTESTVIKGVVVKLSGKVMLTPKGASVARLANLNDIIGEGDNIQTSESGFIEIKFDNGCGLSLKPNTQVKITRLLMDPKTGEYQNLFESSQGKIKARIENLKGRSTFEIKTPTAICGARGTFMYLEVTPAKVTVFFEGGNGYINNLISSLEKQIAAGNASYSDDSGNVSDPAPVSEQERESMGSGWDTGTGTEGYSAPEGGGLYLSDNDTGSVNIIDGVTGGIEGEDGGLFSDPLFDTNTGSDPTETIEVIEATPTSTGEAHAYNLYYGMDNGGFGGAIALIGTFWDADDTALFISGASAGDSFRSEGYEPFIWTGDVSSGTEADSYMTYDGGAFRGIIGGIGGSLVIDEASVTNMLTGFMKVLFIDASGNAGIAGGDLFGAYSSDRYLLFGDIAQTRNFGNIGVTANELYNSIWYGGGDGYLYGLLGDGNYIEGYDSLTTLSIVNRQDYVAQNWGIYGHRFDYGMLVGAISDVWQAHIGGYDSFGAYSYSYDDGEGNIVTDFQHDYGYWIADVDGESKSEDDTISATLKGKFLTETKMGIMSGELLGIYEYGRWHGAGAGEWEGTPLGLSGRWGETGMGIYDNDGGYISGSGETRGLLGYASSPWDGGGRVFVAMGEYYYSDGQPESEQPGPYIWNVPIQSHNAILDNNTTLDGGALYGFTGGVWNNQRMFGTAAAIYIDEYGTAGYFSGDLSGNYYPRLDMWEAQSISMPLALVMGLELNPVNLTLDDAIKGGSLSAVLSGGGAFGGEVSYINGGGSSGSIYYIGGERWGIYNLMLGSVEEGHQNTFDNPNNSKTWMTAIQGEGEFGDEADSKGLLRGSVFGTYYDGGESDRDWVATSIGTWRSYEEGVDASSEYYGFMGGVWDGETIIGKIVAVYGDLIGSGRVFSGTGLAGFNDIGNMAVTDVRGIDPGIESAASPWGIWRADLNGTGAPTSPFKLTMGGTSEEGYWIGLAAGARRPGTNIILGAYRGILLDVSNPLEPEFQDANLYIGDLFGGLTGGDSWQAVMLGEWGEGPWRTTEAQLPYNLSDFLNNFLEIESHAGSFAGGFFIGGSITQSLATATVMESIKLIGQDWGIYYSASAGTYSNPDRQTTWSGETGGGSIEEGAFWLSHMSGTWSDGEIRGVVSGHTISDGSRGTIEGELYGSYDAANWKMVSVGSWIDDPLSYNGKFIGKFGYFGATPTDPQKKVRLDSSLDTNYLEALFGGEGDLWGAGSKSLTMIGKFSNPEKYKLWGNDDVTAAVADTAGVQLKGIMGGTSVNNLLKGLFLAIYIRPDGEGYKAGYISSSDLTGHFYGIKMFEAQSYLNTYLDVAVEGGLSIIEDAPSYGVVNGGQLNGTMEVMSWSIKNHGEEWSAWRMGSGGTFAGTPSQNWHAASSGSSERYSGNSHGFSLWAVNILGNKWSGNELSAKLAGLTVDYDKSGTEPTSRISLIEGSMVGAYDETPAHLWEALGGGITIETIFADGLRANEKSISGIDSSLTIGNMNGTGTGSFGGVGAINIESLSGKTVNFTGESQGVWAMAGSGSYNYSSAPEPGPFNWSLPLKGDFVSEGTYWLGDMSGTGSGTPDPVSGDLELEGLVRGIYLKLNGDGSLSGGKIEGNAKGEYIEAPDDPSNGTWNTVSAGEWVEAASLLDTTNPTSLDTFNNDLMAKAQAADIPITVACSSIMAGTGAFNVTGGGAITIDLFRMNFYQIAGGSDGAWAGILQGTYRTPTDNNWHANVAGNLFNTEGNSIGTVNAELQGTRWDDVNLQWQANVINGSTNTGVDFNGTAAGTINTQPEGENPGTFSGGATGTFTQAT